MIKQVIKEFNVHQKWSQKKSAAERGVIEHLRLSWTMNINSFNLHQTLFYTTLWQQQQVSEFVLSYIITNKQDPGHKFGHTGNSNNFGHSYSCCSSSDHNCSFDFGFSYSRISNSNHSCNCITGLLPGNITTVHYYSTTNHSCSSKGLCNLVQEGQYSDLLP